MRCSGGGRGGSSPLLRTGRVDAFSAEPEAAPRSRRGGNCAHGCRGCWFDDGATGGGGDVAGGVGGDVADGVGGVPALGIALTLIFLWKRQLSAGARAMWETT